MGPKRGDCVKVNKRKTLTIELKKAIVEIYEKGAKQKDIAAKFQLHKSTVQTILANKEKIKQARVSKGISKLHAESQRKNSIDEMEKLLLIWINQRKIRGDSTTQDIICQKARFIYENLNKKKQEEGHLDEGKETSEEFKASRGWFHRFCKRTGIHSFPMVGEPGTCDKESAEKFVKELHNIIKTEGYVKQQLFNADETDLYWKKMPSKMFITQDEKMSDVKLTKDRLTILLGANCSGDFKLKPLLVYNVENPKAFKKKTIIKSKLPVMWRANKKAWVTQVLFKEWIFTVFAPSVKSYLEESGLPLKALLILDNAPGHPKEMEEILQESFSWLKILYMPPNTTAILQPMDQLVITNFKKLYTRELFKNCFENCQYSTSEVSVKQFWMEEYDIVEAIKLIQRAWDQVTEKTLNSAWRQLIPDFVLERATSDDDIAKEIISTAHELEMEVDEKDVQELIQEDQEQVSLEELQQLAYESMLEPQVEISSDDEELDIKKEHVPVSVIKELITKWEDVRKIVSEWHPNLCEVNQVSDLFENKVIHYFHDLHKKKGKQSTPDLFPNQAKNPKTDKINSSLKTEVEIQIKTEKCTEYL